MPQYFFNFDFKQNNSTNGSNHVGRSKYWFKHELLGANVDSLPPPIKIELFPIQKNSIFVRVDNVADLFDEIGTNFTFEDLTLDLVKLANSIYISVNTDNSTLNHINI